MPKLTFRTTRDGHVTSVALPLQVREPDLTFVQSAVTGQPVKLSGGKYLVTAQFPGGREVSKFVDVSDGQDDVEERIDLRLGGSELYRASSGYQSMFLSAAVADRNLYPVSKEPARVRSLTLRMGAAPAWAEDWPASKPLPTHLEFGFSPNERKLAIVERTGHAPIAVALPGYFLLPGTIEFLLVSDPAPAPRLVVKAHPFNRVADWLLGYLRAGAWGGAVVLADGIESATDLVHNKREDPIAAAIGALVLLRAGRADDLRGWAELLKNYRPWFPDAQVILAECAARRGEHREAFELLAGLPAEVTPMFADGLRYALDRLGAYLDAPSRFDLGSKNRTAAAEVVFDRLCAIATRADSAEPILTLEGPDVLILLTGSATMSDPTPNPNANPLTGSATTSDPTPNPNANPFAEFPPPLGRLSPERQVEKLKEIGADAQIAQVERLAQEAKGQPLGSPRDLWWALTGIPGWAHTGMKLGYLSPLPETNVPAVVDIQDPGTIATDTSLSGQRLTLTLNRLQAADYPGGGTHRVLFTFHGRNQAQAATEEVAFNLTTRIRERQSAAVLGLPIFVGLKLGAEGLQCRGQIHNVANESDEEFLAGLESGPFKGGLRLLESAQPAIQPFTALAMGVAKAIGSRNRNQTVYEFNIGLDFSTTPGGARLREGLYLVAQVPDMGDKDELKWADWVFLTGENRIVRRDDYTELLAVNYFAVGIRRSAAGE